MRMILVMNEIPHATRAILVKNWKMPPERFRGIFFSISGEIIRFASKKEILQSSEKKPGKDENQPDKEGLCFLL